jgi:hypothetical protein
MAAQAAFSFRFVRFPFPFNVSRFSKEVLAVSFLAFLHLPRRSIFATKLGLTSTRIRSARGTSRFGEKKEMRSRSCVDRGFLFFIFFLDALR